MKRRIILAIVSLFIMAGMAAPVIADSQVNIGVNFPAYIGITYDGEAVTEQLPATFPVPDLMYNYYFGPDSLKLGVGFRLWSLILISAAYPIASLEMEMGPLVLNANIGGGAFALHAIGSGITVDTGNVFFPEVSAAFRLTDWFSVGVSALGIYLPDVTNEGMGFVVNVLGRFRVTD